jgi:sarcosine/dimethylglycine N-methyltransferase
LNQRTDIVQGSFEFLPFYDASFDVVWSQDALLHCGNRTRVFKEVARVLRKGGDFIFTDPIQRRNADASAMRPILDRLGLTSMATVRGYQDIAGQIGWEDLGFLDLTPHLETHYSRVLEETVHQEAELRMRVGYPFIERTKLGLRHWIEGARLGSLQWGIFHFRA